MWRKINPSTLHGEPVTGGWTASLLEEPSFVIVFSWSPGTHASRVVVDFPSHLIMSSPYTQSTPWCVFSITSFLIKRRLLVNSWHTGPHMAHVHWTWSGSVGNCRVFVSKWVISSTANSLRYGIPLSIVVHSSGCHIPSSLQGYLYLMFDRSHLQRSWRLMSLFQSLCQRPFSYKVIQLLDFPNPLVQATGPTMPASKQPGNNVLMLDNSWNLFTHHTAHLGTGIECLPLLLPLPSALMMSLLCPPVVNNLSFVSISLYV